MKKFKVTASSISYYTIEVEAENEDEAWALGREADGGDFAPDGEGDWEIYAVTEIE